MSLVTQIGLMDTTGTVDAQLMETVAAALNLQVTRDLPQFWPITATVIHLSNPRRVPPGVWPVQLIRELPQPCATTTSTRSVSLDFMFPTKLNLVEPPGT
jgi:hypothetical protein